MSLLSTRVAGAPISWGVCEVPGWGHQLTADRVLTEMRELGLGATELGPDGFLPPGAVRSYGLVLAGAFVPVVLHDPAYNPIPQLERVMDGLEKGTPLVLAAATGLSGYDERPILDAKAWVTLLANLDAITARAADRGHPASLHPHVGTVVERKEEVDRVLDGSGVALCLDTGHLLIGGTEPMELARRVPRRIAHVHLKDVDQELADRVRGGELTYTEAVGAGMYRPLGTGDIDIAGIVRALEGSGYQGWYVMEQDTILDAEPAPGEGPIRDVRAGVQFLGEVSHAL